MYDRDIGPLAIPRGLNSPWTKGGLQYAPPMR
jgi:general L-amino acid transport system substrate-binding protein